MLIVVSLSDLIRPSVTFSKGEGKWIRCLCGFQLSWLRHYLFPITYQPAIISHGTIILFFLTGQALKYPNAPFEIFEGGFAGEADCR